MKPHHGITMPTEAPSKPLKTFTIPKDHKLIIVPMGCDGEDNPITGTDITRKHRQKAFYEVVKQIIGDQEITTIDQLIEAIKLQKQENKTHVIYQHLGDAIYPNGVKNDKKGKAECKKLQTDPTVNGLKAMLQDLGATDEEVTPEKIKELYTAIVDTTIHIPGNHEVGAHGGFGHKKPSAKIMQRMRTDFLGTIAAVVKENLFGEGITDYVATPDFRCVASANDEESQGEDEEKKESDDDSDEETNDEEEASPPQIISAPYFMIKQQNGEILEFNIYLDSSCILHDENQRAALKQTYQQLIEDYAKEFGEEKVRINFHMHHLAMGLVDIRSAGFKKDKGKGYGETKGEIGNQHHRIYNQIFDVATEGLDDTNSKKIQTAIHTGLQIGSHVHRPATVLREHKKAGGSIVKSLSISATTGASDNRGEKHGSGPHPYVTTIITQGGGATEITNHFTQSVAEILDQPFSKEYSLKNCPEHGITIDGVAPFSDTMQKIGAALTPTRHDKDNIAMAGLIHILASAADDRKAKLYFDTLIEKLTNRNKDLDEPADQEQSLQETPSLELKLKIELIEIINGYESKEDEFLFKKGTIQIIREVAQSFLWKEVMNNSLRAKEHMQANTTEPESCETEKEEKERKEEKCSNEEKVIVDINSAQLVKQEDSQPDEETTNIEKPNREKPNQETPNQEKPSREKQRTITGLKYLAEQDEDEYSFLGSCLPESWHPSFIFCVHKTLSYTCLERAHALMFKPEDATYIGDNSDNNDNAAQLERRQVIEILKSFIKQPFITSSTSSAAAIKSYYENLKKICEKFPNVNPLIFIDPGHYKIFGVSGVLPKKTIKRVRMLANKSLKNNTGACQILISTLGTLIRSMKQTAALRLIIDSTLRLSGLYTHDIELAVCKNYARATIIAAILLPLIYLLKVRDDKKELPGYLSTAIKFLAKDRPIDHTSVNTEILESFAQALALLILFLKETNRETKNIALLIPFVIVISILIIIGYSRTEEQKKSADAFLIAPQKMQEKSELLRHSIRVLCGVSQLFYSIDFLQSFLRPITGMESIQQRNYISLAAASVFLSLHCFAWKLNQKQKNYNPLFNTLSVILYIPLLFWQYTIAYGLIFYELEHHDLRDLKTPQSIEFSCWMSGFVICASITGYEILEHARNSSTILTQKALKESYEKVKRVEVVDTSPVVEIKIKDTSPQGSQTNQNEGFQTPLLAGKEGRQRRTRSMDDRILSRGTNAFDMRGEGFCKDDNEGQPRQSPPYTKLE